MFLVYHINPHFTNFIWRKAIFRSGNTAFQAGTFRSLPEYFCQYHNITVYLFVRSIMISLLLFINFVISSAARGAFWIFARS